MSGPVLNNGLNGCYGQVEVVVFPAFISARGGVKPSNHLRKVDGWTVWLVLGFVVDNLAPGNSVIDSDTLLTSKHRQMMTQVTSTVATASSSNYGGKQANIRPPTVVCLALLPALLRALLPPLIY